MQLPLTFDAAAAAAAQLPLLLLLLLLLRCYRVWVHAVRVAPAGGGHLLASGSATLHSAGDSGSGIEIVQRQLVAGLT